MKAIVEHTRAEAWLSAVKHLSETEDCRELNLVLEVSNPGLATPFSRLIEEKVDTCLKKANQQPLHTVAETIFPAVEYRRYGARGVFEIYPDEIYPLIQPVNKTGTYAYRLVRGYDQKNQPCNPLKNRLELMKKELSHKGTKMSVYEVSLDEAYSIPVNRNDTTYIGFPCLSHLSFKLCSKNNLIHLTAIYRSQYFFEKALGNLLGLARLQGFMANELKVKPGVLVCHATDAKLDFPTKFGKAKLMDLIQYLESKRNENQRVPVEG